MKRLSLIEDIINTGIYMIFWLIAGVFHWHLFNFIGVPESDFFSSTIMFLLLNFLGTNILFSLINVTIWSKAK
jgi:hypothetical protein